MVEQKGGPKGVGLAERESKEDNPSDLCFLRSPALLVPCVALLLHVFIVPILLNAHTEVI